MKSTIDRYMALAQEQNDLMDAISRWMVVLKGTVVKVDEGCQAQWEIPLGNTQHQCKAENIFPTALEAILEQIEVLKEVRERGKRLAKRTGAGK